VLQAASLLSPRHVRGAKGDGRVAKIDKSFFRYVWRNSKREQVVILAIVLASLP
jgi:hypothetical protein